MIFFSLILMILLIHGYVIFSHIQKIQFAVSTLEYIRAMHSAGVISKVQAKVFLNDIRNPYDTVSIMEVRRELQRIMESSRAKSKNTNR